jgi:Ca2+-binding RTX toxin-like protein
MIHAADVGSNVYSAFDNQNGPSTFNITGTQDLNIGAKIGDAMSSSSDTFGFHSSANVDASSFTGNLRIAGSSSADVLTGGSGNDIFYGMGGDDVLRGNDGADQFRFVGDSSTDLLVDFTAGTDKIGFNTTTTINFSNTTATNAGATLSAADYIENRSAITALGASDDDKVVEMQAALSTGQVASDVGAAVDAFVLLFNSTTTKGELWYDSDWSNAGGRTQVATFDNVDDLVGIQGMSNTDFVEFIA